MMYRDYGSHKVPAPFQDEDKYVGFTKPQIAIMLPVVILCFAILVQTFRWNIFPIGIVLSILLGALVVFILRGKVPPHRYLLGSGLNMGILLIRILKKKFPMNQRIYSKFCNIKVKGW